MFFFCFFFTQFSILFSRFSQSHLHAGCVLHGTNGTTIGFRQQTGTRRGRSTQPVDLYQLSVNAPCTGTVFLVFFFCSFSFSIVFSTQHNPLPRRRIVSTASCAACSAKRGHHRQMSDDLTGGKNNGIQMYAYYILLHTHSPCPIHGICGVQVLKPYNRAYLNASYSVAPDELEVAEEQRNVYAGPAC